MMSHARYLVLDSRNGIKRCYPRFASATNQAEQKKDRAVEPILAPNSAKGAVSKLLDEVWRDCHVFRRFGRTPCSTVPGNKYSEYVRCQTPGSLGAVNGNDLPLGAIHTNVLI